jgi:hypothetical protein
MQHTHQSRSFTPALKPLEDRCLLFGAHHGIPAMMVMKAPTQVVLMSDSISTHFQASKVTPPELTTFQGEVCPNMGGTPWQMEVSPVVPEPSSAVLLSAAIGVMCVVNRIRKRQAA